MAQYVCRVADAQGRIFQQVESAPSETEVRQMLSERGLFVYSIRPRLGVLPSGWSRGQGAGRRLPGTDFLVFNQQFNTLIKAGLPILRALDLLAERAASPRLRPLLRRVRERVSEGALLSDAFAAEGVFPKVYTTSVLAGEKSGNLSGVLEQYIAYQRITTAFRRRLLAALVYPCILVLVAAGILTYIVTYVIPQFARLYTELRVTLPWMTQLLVGVTMNVRGWVMAAVILAAAGGVAAWFWSRTEAGGLALDRLRFRLPLAGEAWKKFEVAQFARTLATLLQGGTPLVAALDTAAGAASSPLVSQAVARAAEAVREGQPLNRALAATGVFPDLALEMTEVGEATGALVPMLTSVAEFYEEEVSLRLTTLVNIVEPVVLVFMGVVVAFILISLYLPIFSFSVPGSAT
jgi:type IV pilus assembly protein PilC